VINEGVNGDIAVQVTHMLQEDVLSQSGVTDAIVEVGTNDISIGMTAPQIEQNLVQIADTLHQHGIHVIGATLVPRGAYAGLSGHGDFPGASQTRAQVNQWIRTTPMFEGVLDIAKVVGQPSNDNLYQPRYDSGDHLHPNTAGYQAIANSFNLALLEGSQG
jgi:lysophospholipase L1-like esterase